MAKKRKEKNQFRFSIIMKVPETSLSMFILGLSNCTKDEAFALSVAHTASCENSKSLQVS